MHMAIGGAHEPQIHTDHTDVVVLLWERPSGRGSRVGQCRRAVVAFHRVPLAAGTNEVVITLAPLPVITTGEAPTVAEDFGSQLTEDDRVELLNVELSTSNALLSTPVEYGQTYRMTVETDRELVLTGLVVWEEPP
jgi:hypothetical protein